MTELLAAEGVEAIEGIYVCPHRPEDACGCRKPAPGLAVPRRRRARLRPVALVRRGRHGRPTSSSATASVPPRSWCGPGSTRAIGSSEPADHVAADLVEAAAIIAGLVGEESA